MFQSCSIQIMFVVCICVYVVMPLDEVQVIVDAERPVLDEQPEERGAAGTALEVDNYNELLLHK